MPPPASLQFLAPIQPIQPLQGLASLVGLEPLSASIHQPHASNLPAQLFREPRQFGKLRGRWVAVRENHLVEIIDLVNLSFATAKRRPLRSRPARAASSVSLIGALPFAGSRSISSDSADGSASTLPRWAASHARTSSLRGLPSQPAGGCRIASTASGSRLNMMAQSGPGPARQRGHPAAGSGI